MSRTKVELVKVWKRRREFSAQSLFGRMYFGYAYPATVRNAEYEIGARIPSGRLRRIEPDMSIGRASKLGDGEGADHQSAQSRHIECGRIMPMIY